MLGSVNMSTIWDVVGSTALIGSKAFFPKADMNYKYMYVTFCKKLRFCLLLPSLFSAPQVGIEMRL